jgi:hypothetical protein
MSDLAVSGEDLEGNIVRAVSDLKGTRHSLRPESSATILIFGEVRL